MKIKASSVWLFVLSVEMSPGIFVLYVLPSQASARLYSTFTFYVCLFFKALR